MRRTGLHCEGTLRHEEAPMSEPITWRKDVDAALADAARDHRPVLIDFTAAPT